MSRPEDGSHRWLSFHLFLPRTVVVNPFLVECLGPWLGAQVGARRIKRFFFIRYSEGGNHVRLRFLPHHSCDGGAIASGLEQCVESGLAHGDYTLERHRYDRSELYFGETLASVYAELLNEATSWLCLRLLRSFPTANGLAWQLVLAAVLSVVLQRATTSAEEMQASVADSRAFASRAIVSAGGDAPTMEPGAMTELRAAVVALIPRIRKALESDPSVTHIIRALRRARHTGDRERFAATHALHLLCNKAGVSLRVEWCIFTIIPVCDVPARS